MESAGIRAQTESRTSVFLQDWRVTLALIAFGFGLLVVVILTFAVQHDAQVRARSDILAELDQLRDAYHVRLNNRDVDEGALR